MRYRRFLLGIILLSMLTVLSITTGTSPLPVMKAWLVDALPLVPLGLAAGLIISCGQIDIASGSVFSAAGMIALFWTYALTNKPFLGLAVSLAFAIAFYGLMYWLVVHGKIPSLLCTLGMAMCAKSISIVFQAALFGIGIATYHHLLNIDKAHSGRMTLPISPVIQFTGSGFVWGTITVGLLILWRYYSNFGLDHIALGMNSAGAEFAGVNRARVFLIAFLVSGMLVGISSVSYLTSVANGGWTSDQGWGYELTAIAAAVLGGTRISGGRFDPLCIALGVLVVHGMHFIVTASLIPNELELFILGIAVAGVGLTDSWSAKRPLISAH